MTEEFTSFWDGPFSQWDAAYFKIDDVEYNCAEQYMMATKARLFDDADTLAMIMDAGEPRMQKRLGRLVEDFDPRIWEETEDNGMPHCWNVVWKGSHAKFTQNAGHLELLLETASTTLVEASPEDCVWGIGLAEDDEGARDRHAWRGMNWLGQVLTDLRDQLLLERQST